jgi:flagellar hook-associated protein 1 FlgK
MHDVVWKDTETSVSVKNGELAGLIEVRDVIIRQNITDVNALAINLSDLTNEVHKDGFGRRGQTNLEFFRHLNISDNNEGNFDINNDCVNDITAIYKVAGNNKLDASAAIGIAGTLTFARNDKLDSIAEVDYNESDTVNSVMKKINDANVGVVAYIDHNGHFALKATAARDDDRKHFMIRHLEDSGQFFVGLTGVLKQSGQSGSFDYRRIDDIMKFIPQREHITITPKFNPAAHVAVSEAVIRDVDVIAASKGKDVGGTGDYNVTNGIGDGTNALEIASLRHKTSMVDTKATFNEFYTALISRIGSQGEETKNRIENQTVMLKNLENMRESVSGINLDEEMAGMVAYQHGYNASARMISTIDKMLETIIRLGA